MLTTVLQSNIHSLIAAWGLTMPFYVHLEHHGGHSKNVPEEFFSLMKDNKNDIHSSHQTATEM